MDIGLHELTSIYPNRVQTLYGAPCVIFRDHRWTLPVVFLAGKEGILNLPVRMVTFDRHPDSLSPIKGTVPLELFRREEQDLKELVGLVRDHLSPRDDDWIIAGIELGLLSDVIQLGSLSENPEGDAAVTRYRDKSGLDHRIFHLRRPLQELSYKGAFADPSNSAVKQGLWDILEWFPGTGLIQVSKKNLVTDIDLDFFTFSWERYIFPFSQEVYENEFYTHSQSSYGCSGLRPVDWMRGLIASSGLINMACEPDFCGGNEKSEQVLADVNRFLFESQINTLDVSVDYHPEYPTE
ncbi:MAG: hypothetical protein WCU00_06600 [Candidatus Latescibacterota bacterium]